MRQTRLLVAAALLLVSATVLHAADLPLAAAGATRYQIVQPVNPSDVDDYAVRILAGYLKRTTGGRWAGMTSPRERIGCTSSGRSRWGRIA